METCARTGSARNVGACMAGPSGGCAYCGITAAVQALSDDELLAGLRDVFGAVDPVPAGAVPDPAVLATAAVRRAAQGTGRAAPPVAALPATTPAVPAAAAVGAGTAGDHWWYCVTCDADHIGACPAVTPPGHRMWRPLQRLLDRLADQLL